MVGSWSTSSGSVTFYRNDFSTLGRCTKKLKMTFQGQNVWGALGGSEKERKLSFSLPPRCISRRSPWPHLSRTWSRSGWSSHWVQRALNRGDSGGRSSETGAADRVGSLRTLPSEVVVPTGRNWAHMTWKCPPKSSKNGGGDNTFVTCTQPVSSWCLRSFVHKCFWSRPV